MKAVEIRGIGDIALNGDGARAQGEARPPSRKRGLRRPFCGFRKALCPAAVDQDTLLLFQVRVLGEELDFVAVGQPQHTSASVALEGGRCHEPNPLFDYRVAAELAFKGEFDVPQSG
jgi:hypothetical protein